MCVHFDNSGKIGKKSAAVSAEVDTFAVDLEDDRFRGLLNKDGRFGIDPTSQDFKSRDTKEMKRILHAQRVARHNEDNNAPKPAEEHAPQTQTVTTLAAKLKRKFGTN